MRKICPECSTERPVSDQESRFSGIRVGTPVRYATALTAQEKISRKLEGTLCTRCGGTGYQGRIGSYELMKVSRSICDAIKQQKSTQEIEDLAVQEGMITLKAYAADLVTRQLTTLSEMQKICNIGQT
jgi:type IV pilus assembly protein PilB